MQLPNDRKAESKEQSVTEKDTSWELCTLTEKMCKGKRLFQRSGALKTCCVKVLSLVPQIELSLCVENR